MLKQKVSEWLNHQNGSNNGRGKIPLLERLIMVLIILNVISVVIEPSFTSPDFLYGFRLFEIFSVAVFTVEYILRVWISDILRPELKPWKARLAFVFSLMAIIDLLAILPFFIPFIISVDLRILRILRLMRLTRVFKINRYTKAMSVLLKVLSNKKEQLLSAFIVAFMLIILASTVMYSAENVAQPEVFTSVIHTMWWAIATLTTVGYGDIYPITAVGKLLASFIAVLGIGVVAIPTGIIAAGFTEVIDDDKLHDQPLKRFCPYCGNHVDNDMR